MAFRFKVHHDIVYGLKFCTIIRKGKVIVAKDEQVIGTFAPNTESHYVKLRLAETPSGYFKRGRYNGKAMIVDLEGQVHV
mmetsp:Transcript_3879/g.2607  ORF Transcript_3879/g.2607 Transcript_3879/m.2607 type:complete len:80 (-) Transcript_3879:112-351(-)